MSSEPTQQPTPIAWDKYRRFLPLVACFALGLAAGGFVGSGVGWQLRGVAIVADPKPVEPKKPAEPDKIPVGLVRVLIVEETATRSPAFADLMFDPALRKYLSEICAKGTDNKTPEYRVFDKDVNATNAAKQWQVALARAKAHEKFSVPWLVVFNGQTPKYEGPLPTLKADELIRFIGQFVSAGPPPITPVSPAKPVEPAKPFTPEPVVERACPDCGGSGEVRFRLFRWRTCPTCWGTGKVR